MKKVPESLEKLSVGNLNTIVLSFRLCLILITLLYEKYTEYTRYLIIYKNKFHPFLTVFIWN